MKTRLLSIVVMASILQSMVWGQLESRNSYNQVDRMPSKSYDLKEQDIIYGALLSSCAHAPYIVEELVRSIDNGAYCYTGLNPSKSTDVSVGTAVQLILVACVTLHSNEVEIFCTDLRAAANQPLLGLGSANSSQDYWRTLLKDGLYPIQVASAERQIAVLENLTYDNFKPTWSRIAKLTEPEFDSYRKKVLNRLKITKAILDRTQRPVSPDGAILFDHVIRTGHTILDK